MRTSLVLLIVFVMLFSAFSPTNAAGSNYFVSPSGLDTNVGTITAPFKTIQKAVSKVVGGDTVYIRGGTYKERIEIAYKGNAAGPFITFSAYGDEEVIIDGTNIGIDIIKYGEGLFNIKQTSYVRLINLNIKNSNGAGIYAAYGSNIEVISSSTYNTVKSGIGFWYVTNGIIDGNDIQLACCGKIGTVSSPSCPTQTNLPSEEPITVNGGSYIEVMYNTVHNGPVGLPTSRAGGEGINTKWSANNIYVHNNEVYGMDGKVGLSVDAWGGLLQNVYYYNNVSHDNLVGLLASNEGTGGSAKDVYFYNNIIYNNSHTGIYVPGYMGNGPVENIYFINNTVYNNGIGFNVVSTNLKNVVARNNILYKNKTATFINASAIPYVILDHNLLVDPLFVNPVVFDFHLKSNSPAIDTGSSLNAFGTDFDGIVRPQGIAIDIGAFEFVQSVVPTNTATFVPTLTKTPTFVPTIAPTFTSTPTKTKTTMPTFTPIPPTFTAVPTSTAIPIVTQECYLVTFLDGTKISVCKVLP